MTCQVSTYYDKKSEIFYKTYAGEVRLEDIFESWESIFKEGLLKGHSHKILIDYSDATILFPPQKTVEIAKFYKAHDSIFYNSKIAMIMVTPSQAVFPHLIELENISFKIDSFSTKTAAQNWLME